jgi:hypothetical protein
VNPSGTPHAAINSTKGISDTEKDATAIGIASTDLAATHNRETRQVRDASHAHAIRSRTGGVASCSAGTSLPAVLAMEPL